MQIQETYDRVRILADRKWEKQNRRPPGYASNARRVSSNFTLIKEQGRLRAQILHSMRRHIAAEHMVRS